MTGASGMALPRHLLAAMANHPEVEQVHLVVSGGAAKVLKHEAELAGNPTEALIEAASLADEARENDVAEKTRDACRE